VCYCLGVTAVDPVRMGLLFERFLSKERAEPPDIDLDIEHERREEVIQHVYAKYGRTHAAMVAVVITYRPRSAARDVGKALGMTETELGRLARTLEHHGGLSAEALKLAELDPDAPLHQQLVALGEELLGFPRHLSIHPGGFLLGHEPVDTLVPIENGTMADRTVIQWDKDDVDTLGLFKVDLLGLGTLTHLRRCFDLIRRHEGLDYEMATVPTEDPATYDMVCTGDTVGVFQIESRAQMVMLPRLRPRTYYDLVIEISLVRPGPITGGMVHPYLRRRTGLEEVVYPHESLRPVLEKTLGVPLFQEQVMKLSVVAAGYTPGEADQLRRDMGAWRQPGRLEAHRERITSRMIANGVAPEFAERVFKQIQGFGEYGFPEAHAASFALLSYLGAYLRRHHLAAFACSLLNSLPMGFYNAATIVEDARRKGVEIRPIDIKVSTWDCALERGPDGALALRLGLRGIKGLGEADGLRIQALAAQAPYRDLEDFVYRTDLDERSLAGLAEAGAFDPFGLTRREALWEVRGLARSQPLPLDLGPGRMAAFKQLTLFETINWDFERAGASARGHPLAPLRPLLMAQGLPDARGIARMAHGARVRYAGVVICRQRPGTAADVTFMTLEDETGFVNLVIWPRVWQQNKLMARLEPVLGVSGRLQVLHGVVHLIADRFWKPRLGGEGPAVSRSRDFH
jgi:error-prone DNA polymerase